NPGPVVGSGGLLGPMSEYPIQLEKVHAPPLRDDILARDRLLDWLNVRIHSRVVLLTAEAGYGKTTLLADFARRTRLLMVWFRLPRLPPRRRLRGCPADREPNDFSRARTTIHGVCQPRDAASSFRTIEEHGRSRGADAV